MINLPKHNIQLRELTIDDASLIFDLINAQREYLGRWLPFVPFTQHVIDTESFILAVTSDESDEKVFTIWYQQVFVGLIGLKNIDPFNCRAELGYWLSEDYQGLGIVTNACIALMEFAFSKMNLNRIQLRAAVENQKSRKVAERLGMQLEGFERQGERHNDKFWDLAVYSLLKNEFWK